MTPKRLEAELEETKAERDAVREENFRLKQMFGVPME